MNSPTAARDGVPPGLLDRFQKLGQAHVFRHWDGLDESGRDRLIQQCERLAPDLEGLLEEQKRAVEALGAGAAGGIAPYPAIARPEAGGDAAAFDAARSRGLALLHEGRVGVFVVAGGQGTRLGHDGPKGSVSIGPVSDRSLFALQAQKIRGLARRLGRSVPWYVMTSESTDAATRALFETESFFGLDPKDVVIFSQSMVPAADFDGRLIMAERGRIFENPNGHGGALPALVDSGATADMRARGIDRLFYYQVDNPLVAMADPVFLGFHELEGAEVSCKVIRKTDPDEKVGVVALEGGKARIVEYTELRDAERHARDDSGQLAFWAGSIACHVFNVDFVERIAAAADRVLPLHASPKPIRCVDSEGAAVEPSEPNGYKFERFVFDVLPAAGRVCVLEVQVADEFAPVKNARGRDSLETARAALVAQARSWLERAGADLSAVAAVELDYSKIDSAEEAAEAVRAQGIDELVAAGESVLVTGMGS